MGGVAFARAAMGSSRDKAKLQIRSLRNATALLLAGCLSSCTTNVERSEQLRNVVVSDPSASYDLASVEELEKAKKVLQRGSEDYLEEQAYIDFARYTTDQALLYLLNNRPREARDLYSEAVRNLVTDVQKHHVFIEEEKEKRKNRLAKNTKLIYGWAALLTAKTFGKNNPYINKNIFDFANKQAYESVRSGTAIIDQMQKPVAPVPAHLQADFYRMPFFAHFHPLASIGRLKHRGKRKCTLSLVGHRIALTNAHCVIDDNGQILEQGLTANFLKLAAYRKDDADPEDRFEYMDIGATVAQISPEYFEAKNPFEKCRNDWALLSLVKHPPDIEYLEVPSVAIRQSPTPAFIAPEVFDNPIERVAVAGYSNDRNAGDLITMDYGCPLGSLFDSQTMSYRCATWKGASGAPVLATGDPKSLSMLLGLHACNAPWLTREMLSTSISRDELESVGTASAKFIPALTEMRTGLMVSQTDGGRVRSNE